MGTGDSNCGVLGPSKLGATAFPRQQRLACSCCTRLLEFVELVGVQKVPKFDENGPSQAQTDDPNSPTADQVSTTASSASVLPFGYIWKHEV